MTASLMSSPAIDQLLRELCAQGASDLHVCVGMPPLMRKDGDIQPLGSDAAVLDGAAIASLLQEIMPPANRAEFEARHDTDFAHEIQGLARFRANVFADRKGMGAVFRVIPSAILSAEALNLSPHILQLCSLTKGLVLVTGPTGSGKSTTLCALVDYINRHRHEHIITIEDPIEFVHPNKSCLINQREVRTHTDSFKAALRAALREDPDIILVGELRDLETIAIAIETAETGHLVFGTLHTTTAASTVDRVIDQFPADRQAQIRVMLSESLRGRHRADAVPQDRRRPRRRARGAARQRRDLEPDPRGQDVPAAVDDAGGQGQRHGDAQRRAVRAGQGPHHHPRRSAAQERRQGGHGDDAQAPRRGGLSEPARVS